MRELSPAPRTAADLQTVGLFEYFTVQRELRGIRYCKKELVGPMRKRAGPALPPNVTALPGSVSQYGSRDWALALERHCWACKGCKWALK
jgi:hypothetical protein